MTRRGERGAVAGRPFEALVEGAAAGVGVREAAAGGVALNPAEDPRGMRPLPGGVA